jgi:hypothetical protein
VMLLGSRLALAAAMLTRASMAGTVRLTCCLFRARLVRAVTARQQACQGCMN